MNKKNDIKTFTRELNKDNNREKTSKTKNIIISSIKKQMIVIILVILIIVIIASLLYVTNSKTVETVSNISKAISATGKIGDSDFLNKNEDKGYYEINIDKAYEELEAWAKKNSINLNNMGLTKEIYGEMLKMEAEQTLVSLGGTPVGDNAVQGKIVLNRKKSDGTIVPMKFIKKSEWDQNIIKKKSNEIAGVGIGGTEAKETDDMITDESKRIWMALKTNGWSNYAIAGAIGNMYVESKYSSTKAEGKNEQEGIDYTIEIDKNDKEKIKSEFINDKKGYGLLQWKNKEDKEAIYDISKKNNTSIGDYSIQLKYIQNMAENNKKMQEYIKGKNTEGRDITEIEYAVTAFYEYWIKNNYDFDNKNTSDNERKDDELANRWAAGKAAYEEYVEKLRLGTIVSTNKIASSNKFIGLNNNKNNIKIADAITRSEENGTLTTTSKEGVADLDKLWDETQSSFTLDDNNNVVVGSVYISEIEIIPNAFAQEENYVNKIVTEDGTLIQLDDGREIKNDSNLCYQMQLKQQTISTEELPSSANLSSGTVASIMAATPGDKTTSSIQNKFNELIQNAREQQGKEIDIEDFTTVVVTTKTENMNLKFDVKKTVEFKPDDATQENETKTSEDEKEEEKDFNDEEGYRKIITTEITKIPQAVLSKQKTIGNEVTYHYEENTSEEIEQPDDIEVEDDEEYSGWVVCNKGGDGEKQNSKVQEDYHNFLGGLVSNVGGKEIDTHEHLVQTASNRTIKTQIDTTKSIYAKIGTTVVTNSANALVAFINEANPDEELLIDYLNNAGKVRAEEKDEIVEALLKAKKKDEKSDSTIGNGNEGGTSGYPPNQGGGGDPNPSGDETDDDTQGSDEKKVTIDWQLTNKLAKAAYNYIKKGVKYVANGKDLKTGVNNPQFVYQLLKNETQMYTGEYVKIKEWSTKLEDYIVGNDISLAQEGDVIIYKKAQNDDGNRKICIYSGKDNIIMEVDTTGGTTKKLDLNTYTVDRIYRFNEDGSAPEIDPNIVRLIMIEPPSLKIEEKKKVQLKAITLPTSATKNVKINWKSENKKIATVNQVGKVSTLEYGKVTIIATTNNGKSAKAEIQIGKELQTKYTTDTKEELSGVVDKTKKGKRKNIGVYVGTNEKSVVDGGSYRTYRDVESIAKKFMDTYGVNITCSEEIHSRYYIGYTKMNISKNNNDLKPLDNQEKIDIPRNTKIVVTKKEQGKGNSTGPYYKNSPIYMEIQFKDKDGNVRRFRLNYAYRYLFLNGWINMIGQRWSIEQAEEFVNKTCKADSRTNYCLWVNPYNRIAFLYKGSKGNWKVIKIMDAGNGRWQWNPSSSTSADTSYSLANARNKNGQQKINRKNGVVYNGLYYVMDYARGNCIHVGSPLDYNATHGCISFYSEDCKDLFENLPVETKVILY